MHNVGRTSAFESELGVDVTNPLQAGINIVGARSGQGLSLGAGGSAGAQTQAGAMTGDTFAALIEDFAAGLPQTARSGAAKIAPILHADIAPSTETSASPDETALGDMLAQLLEKLTSLTQTLQGNAAPDGDALNEIAELLAGASELLATLEMPMAGSAAFDGLDELAAGLGLTRDEGSGAAANPFDALASLATKAAALAKDAAPDLSAKLGDFAALLNRHAVAADTAAVQNAEPAPDARKAVLLSTVQANPASEIAAARAAGQNANTSTPEPEADPGADADQSGASKRTLARPADADMRPDTASRQPQSQAQAKAAAQSAVGAISGEAAPSGDKSEILLVPNGSQSTPGQAALGAKPAQAAMPQTPAATPINMQHVAAEITRHVQNGINRFEIRLNPPELGRIDVRMEMDQSGNVVARLAVERSETLDLMQRDQRALERALADAGLDAAKTELEFSLRRDGGDPDDPEDAPWRAGPAASESDQAGTQQAPNAQTQVYRGYARADAVDIRA